jgi:hypothetical protein
MSLEDLRFWLREPDVQFWCVVGAIAAWILFVVTR